MTAETQAGSYGWDAIAAATQLFKFLSKLTEIKRWNKTKLSLVHSTDISNHVTTCSYSLSTKFKYQLNSNYNLNLVTNSTHQWNLPSGISYFFFCKHDRASEKFSAANASARYLSLSSRRHFSLQTLKCSHTQQQQQQQQQCHYIYDTMLRFTNILMHILITYSH